MIILLYDGRCGFCKSSIKLLRALDWCGRLQFENYHDPSVREQYAPELSLDALRKALHARDNRGHFTAGFFAFRTVSRYVPIFWILLPFLYLPGVPWLGTKVYEWIAHHRS